MKCVCGGGGGVGEREKPLFASLETDRLKQSKHQGTVLVSFG